MARHRMAASITAAAVLALSSATFVVAQEDEAAADGTPLMVRAVEYAFADLPTSVPAGTVLGFQNDGVEVHELVLVRIADGVTETLEELLAMEDEGRDVMAEGLVEMVGEMPLFAAPGQTAEDTRALESEGRYVALCFIPQGLTDMSALEQLGPETNPEDLPPELQELMANPPHLALGMIQEFAVTAAGTEVGPLPDMEAMEAAPEGEEDAAA